MDSFKSVCNEKGAPFSKLDSDELSRRVIKRRYNALSPEERASADGNARNECENYVREHRPDLQTTIVNMIVEYIFDPCHEELAVFLAAQAVLGLDPATHPKECADAIDVVGEETPYSIIAAALEKFGGLNGIVGLALD